ncbi:MAG: hypothetical protein O7D29_01990 [Gemmatimonadetes bacterium]|nr:hypothetical protein [Gemmatimonadota bacterium]
MAILTLACTTGIFAADKHFGRWPSWSRRRWADVGEVLIIVVENFVEELKAKVGN